MKNAKIFAVAAVVCALVSCTKSEVPTYSVDDAAVNFYSRSFSFSLKGMTEDRIQLSIPVEVVGPAVDYDRDIELKVTDSTAVLGRDFTVVSSKVSAGNLRDNIVIEVDKLTDDVHERACIFEIVPNEYFRAGLPDYQVSRINWTELYSRPVEGVWRYWYLYICHGYSQQFHKLMVEEFGTDVEKYTLSSGYVKKDTSLILKMPAWWYSAGRQLREVVAEHDAANPDNPYRHSDDYETYKLYSIPVGEGVKPEGEMPTILETLIVL